MTDVSNTVADRVPATRRLELDALRGFAVLLIFWVNIVFFGWPYEANLYPTLFGGPDNLNILGWGINHLLLEGAMFSLFCMLFGASALLLLDEHRLSGPGGLRAVDYYFRRNLWLIGFGLVHAFVLLWPLEILFTYGVLGLALYPLRRFKALTLFAVGLLMTAWGAGLPFPLDTISPAAQAVQHQAASPVRISEMDLLLALQEEIADMWVEMSLYRSDYLSIFQANIDVAVSQQTTTLYEDNLWDAGGMMLIGMALFKWGVLTGRRSLIFYLVLTLLGFAAAILLRLPAVVVGIASGFDPDWVRFIGSPANLVGRLFLALGYIGLIMLLCRWVWLSGTVRALAAAGRLAFTNYVAQTIFAIFLFYGFGFGMFAEFAYYQLLLIVLGFSLFPLLARVVWLHLFRQGPLEWLWRSLIYLQRQPLRRPPPAAGDGVARPAAEVPFA